MQKRYNPELVQQQKELRNDLLLAALEFELTTTETCLAYEQKTVAAIDAIIEELKEVEECDFFKNYKYLITVFFHIIKWVDKEFKGIEGSAAHLKAAKLNAKQFKTDAFHYPESFRERISGYLKNVQGLQDVEDAASIFNEFTRIPFPMIFAIGYDRYSELRHYNRNQEEKSPEEITVVSIEFLIGNEPWANPQVLKPQEIYTIKGKVVINKWPKGYNELLLVPISAQHNSLYELLLPPIEKSNKKEFQITGQIVFKYPQHSFDESMVIKLLACFKNNREQKIPTIVGYDQLIAKVLDPNAAYFMSGFKGFNKAVSDIIATIQKEVETVPKEEMDTFALLLNGIVNYQGYCLQQGIYKNVASMTEDTLRDNLIQHLIGIPYIGEDVNKEAHLAGGRVEIGYKGLIAELKVEKSISERSAMVAKYESQAVAYASGNAKQLSILCVLDLTEKKLPPAAPQNNVFLITPKVHGFENSDPPFPPRQVVVIIDGNTIKPSAYSK